GGGSRADGADARMSVRRAQDHAMGHARQLDIVEELPFAAHEATILLTRHPTAHECLRSGHHRRSSTASMPPPMRDTEMSPSSHRLIWPWKLPGCLKDRFRDKWISETLCCQ